MDEHFVPLSFGRSCYFFGLELDLLFFFEFDFLAFDVGFLSLFFCELFALDIFADFFFGLFG